MERQRKKQGHGNHDGSRRTFRGRGGPRDGNPPKKQHPRRKRDKKEEGASGGDLGDDGDSGDFHALDRVGGEGGVEKEEEDGVEPAQGGGGLSSSSEEDGGEECRRPKAKVEDNDEEDERLRRLMLKIRNVRTMVRQSSGSLRASLDQWRTNCLNPTRNCVTSWRSIVRSRMPTNGGNTRGEGAVGTEGNGGVDDDDDEEGGWCKEPSLAVFELMQSAVQSGPLTGGKPGYFKRCGSEAASVALSFLRDCSGTKDDCVDADDGNGDGRVSDVEARLRSELRFTERQASAVCRWMRDAEKAAGGRSGEHKPPSKSVVKQQKKQQRILDEKREVRSRKAVRARARWEHSSYSDDDYDSGYLD